MSSPRSAGERKSGSVKGLARSPGAHAFVLASLGVYVYSGKENEMKYVCSNPGCPRDGPPEFLKVQERTILINDVGDYLDTIDIEDTRQLLRCYCCNSGAIEKGE